MDNESYDRYEIVNVKRKPIKCPKCGFRPISNIVYGYPSYDEDTRRDLENKKIVLGGCCPSDEQWMCTNCETKFKLELDSDGLVVNEISIK